MATTNITFDDKILGQANALPENKKLTFTNANEIKSVVNNNATELTSTQADVATNTSGIATNVTNIATNAADIATNVTNIATNTSGVASNLASIGTNTTNIATNTSDIATNTTNIATNTTNIASNTSALDLKANLSGATFTGDVVAPDFIGDLNGAIRFNAKNESGSTLLKGKVVAITGVSGNETLVDLADADDVAARPAFGLVFANANNNAACEVVTFGNLSGLNTSSFTEGDTLYVSTVAGELVNVAPTGEAADIQNVGKVIRSHATEGIIKVAGAGRANATPNLDSGKMFLGNASNQSVSVAMSGDVTIDNTGATTVGTINSVPVATITGDIAANATNIESNTTNIATNTSNISTNASNISTNTSNISTNVTNIATNASGIATNAANIATNAGDISTNASNIETNVTAISNRIEKNIGATYTTNALTTLTQAEYDAIDIPDETTVYFIV
jgi:methyl-accepting chemotaxis protein